MERNKASHRKKVVEEPEDRTIRSQIEIKIRSVEGCEASSSTPKIAIDTFLRPTDAVSSIILSMGLLYTWIWHRSAENVDRRITHRHVAHFLRKNSVNALKISGITTTSHV